MRQRAATADATVITIAATSAAHICSWVASAARNLAFCPNTTTAPTANALRLTATTTGSTAAAAPPQSAGHRLNLTQPLAPRRHAANHPAQRRRHRHIAAAAAPCARLTLRRAEVTGKRLRRQLSRQPIPGAAASLSADPAPRNIRPELISGGNTEKFHHYASSNKSFSSRTPARYPKRHGHPSPRRQHPAAAQLTGSCPDRGCQLPASAPRVVGALLIAAGLRRWRHAPARWARVSCSESGEISRHRARVPTSSWRR